MVPVSVDLQGKPGDYEKLGEVIRHVSEPREIELISTGSIVHRLDLFQSGYAGVPDGALEYHSRLISGIESGSWQDVWLIPGQLIEEAKPDGRDLPLRAMAGYTCENFSTEILANEVIAGSISMSTIRFQGIR